MFKDIRTKLFVNIQKCIGFFELSKGIYFEIIINNTFILDFTI